MKTLVEYVENIGHSLDSSPIGGFSRKIEGVFGPMLPRRRYFGNVIYSIGLGFKALSAYHYARGQDEIALPLLGISLCFDGMALFPLQLCDGFVNREYIRKIKEQGEFGKLNKRLDDALATGKISKRDYYDGVSLLELAVMGKSTKNTNTF